MPRDYERSPLHRMPGAKMLLITGATLVLMLIPDAAKFNTTFALCRNWLFNYLFYITIPFIYGSCEQTLSNTRSLSFKGFSKTSTRMIFCILLFAEGTYATPLEEQATTNDYYDSLSLMYLTIVTVFLEIFYRHKNPQVASVDDFLFYVSASVFTLVHLCLYDCWRWSKYVFVPYLAVYILAFFIMKIRVWDIEKKEENNYRLINWFLAIGYGALLVPNIILIELYHSQTRPAIGLKATVGLCIFQLVSCIWLCGWWFYRRRYNKRMADPDKVSDRETSFTKLLAVVSRMIHGYIFYSGIFIVSFNYTDTNALFAKMLVATMSLAIIRPFSYVYQSFGDDIKDFPVRALVYHEMEDDITLLRDNKQRHDVLEDLTGVLNQLIDECGKGDSKIGPKLSVLFDILDKKTRDVV